MDAFEGTAELWEAPRRSEPPLAHGSLVALLEVTRVPGKGLEPLRPQRGHLILSQARMTSFATPAAPE